MAQDSVAATVVAEATPEDKAVAIKVTEEAITTTTIYTSARSFFYLADRL